VFELGDIGALELKKRQKKNQTIFGIAHRICPTKQRVPSMAQATLIDVSWEAK